MHQRTEPDYLAAVHQAAADSKRLESAAASIDANYRETPIDGQRASIGENYQGWRCAEIGAISQTAGGRGHVPSSSPAWTATG